MHVKVLHQKFLQALWHAAPEFEPYDRAETSLLDVVAHGRQQVIGFVFFDFTVGVAGDAEKTGIFYLVAGEKLPHAAHDQVFHQKHLIGVR